MKPLELTAKYKRRGYVLIAFTLSLMLLLGIRHCFFLVNQSQQSDVIYFQPCQTGGALL